MKEGLQEESFLLLIPLGSLARVIFTVEAMSQQHQRNGQYRHLAIGREGVRQITMLEIEAVTETETDVIETEVVITTEIDVEVEVVNVGEAEIEIGIETGGIETVTETGIGIKELSH